MATTQNVDSPATRIHTLALQRVCREGKATRVMQFELGELAVELCAAGDSLWLFIRRPDKGGLALRAAYLAGDFTATKAKAEPGELARIQVDRGGSVDLHSSARLLSGASAGFLPLREAAG